MEDEELYQVFACFLPCVVQKALTVINTWIKQQCYHLILSAFCLLHWFFVKLETIQALFTFLFETCEWIFKFSKLLWIFFTAVDNKLAPFSLFKCLWKRFWDLPEIRIKLARWVALVHPSWTRGMPLSDGCGSWLADAWVAHPCHPHRQRSEAANQLLQPGAVAEGA